MLCSNSAKIKLQSGGIAAEYASHVSRVWILGILSTGAVFGSPALSACSCSSPCSYECIKCDVQLPDYSEWDG